MNKREKALRGEIVSKALATPACFNATMKLLDAYLADDDINDDEAHEACNEALREFVRALGYGNEEEES